MARRAGWRVLDENKGELEPVPSAVATQAPGAEDAVGAFWTTNALPHLIYLMACAAASSY